MRTSHVILAAFVFFTNGFVAGHAGVRSFEKLNLDEQLALARSESHVGVYDRELLTLDQELKHGKISAYDYQWQTQELVTYINTEVYYQNAILKERPLSLDVELPEGATKVLRTVGKYSLGISLALLEGIAQGGGNFSP
jgi:hypothetical protein